MASKEFITKLKESLDIVEVVAESVSLRRAGKYLTGLSPFTKEKTPSFFVNPESQSFYCYSSNQGGDVITFVELSKGFSFQEALEYLAEKTGIPLEKENRSPEEVARERKREEERKLLLKLNRFAAKFFQEQLEGAVGSFARDYIQKRGITQDSVIKFSLGYAPDSWTALRDYLLQIKAPLIQAHELGLLRTKVGEKPKADGSNLFDTFRSRLIFPIRNPNGEVVGFGGRWLGANSKDAPKYLNSPESVVYEKEKLLYNLDQARKSIRETETAVLVEGYMDCLTMVQAGFSNVVANCGTALTRSQAAMLKKLAPRVICLYDSDEAGQAATERAMDLFLDTEGFPLLGATIPDGKDPDEFLHSHGDEGKWKLTEILQNSPALIDRWAEKMAMSTPKTIQARAEALDKIAKKLAKLKDDLWIQARIPNLARWFELDQGLVLETLRKHRKSWGVQGAQREHKFGERPRVVQQAKSGPSASGQFVGLSGQKNEKSKQIQGRSGTSVFGFERRFLADLLSEPSWITKLRELQLHDPSVVLPYLGSVEIKRALEVLLAPRQSAETDGSRGRDLLEILRGEPNLRNFVAKLAVVKSEEARAHKDLDAALVRLREESLKRDTAELRKRIEEAEKNGDVATSEKLLQQLTELRRQLGNK